MKRAALLASLIVSLAVAADARGQPRLLDCGLVQQIPQSECEALFDVFFGLKGLEWLSNRGWLVWDHPCEWLGIECNSKEWPRNVTAIILPDNDVSGNLPEQIGLLTELEILDLGNTLNRGFFKQIEGPLPTSISRLRNLHTLKLSRNALSGILPDEYTELTNLRVLKLDGNALQGTLPPRFYNLTALEELDLSDNELGGILSPALANLTQLKHLDVSSNQFSGALPDVFDALPLLQSLQLQHNRFSGAIPTTLSTLDRLTFFKGHDNQFSSALTPSVADWAAGLSVCELQANPVTLCMPDSPLYARTSAGVCNIEPNDACSFCENNSAIDEAECRPLERFFYATSGPEWTDRTGWMDGGSACDWFGVGCENDRIVRLALPSNNLTGSLPTALADLPALAEVDLSGNRLIGPVPLEVATKAAAGLSCNLGGNDPGLCVPDTAPFRSLGAEPLCGLPLVPACSAPQPARILSFDGRMQDGEVVLSWSAAGSLVGIRFQVEQEQDTRYVAIGNIRATAVDDRYEFRYTPAEAGVGTFRLRQHNLDGSVTLSPPIDVLIGATDSFILEAPYPNPFQNEARLAVGVGTAQHVHVALYDILGRQVRTLLDEPLADGAVRHLRIEAAGLAGGVYLIHVRAATFSATRRISLRR